MLTPSTAHVDEALTNVSVAFKNDEYIAEQLAPVVPVTKQSDFYFKFSKQGFRQVDDSLSPGSQAHTLEVDLDQRGFYKCDGHGIESKIPDELRDNADRGAELEVEFTEKTTEVVLLNEELNLHTIFADVANFSGMTTTLSGTTRWDDYVNSNPFTAIEAKKISIHQTGSPWPNTLVLPQPVFTSIRNHPRVIDRVKYTQLGGRKALTPDEIAQAFDVEKVLVPRALYQTVTEGAVDALDYIWGKDAWLLYVPKKPGKRTPAFYYTFLWTAAGAGYMVKRYRLESFDSEFIKVKKYYDQNSVFPGCAYQWKTAVA